MGCLVRAGCLTIVLAAAGAAYWLYGDQLPGRIGELAGRVGSATAEGDTAKTTARAIPWSSLDDATVDSGTAAIARLGRPNGPQYVTLGAGDLAGFLASALARNLPRSASDPQVAVVGDRILLRAVVDLREFAGRGAFGSVIGAAMNSRDTLTLSGTLDAIRPGMAQYRVRELRLKGVGVPPRVIPSLVGTIRPRIANDSLAPEGMPIPMPRYIGDVRVSGGRVTLYRATP